MYDVLVVGGGAAGMMAAAAAAEKGASVALIEKNEKLGKKIYITGKGRCNLTNASDLEEYFSQYIISNPKFLYSALYGFTNTDMMDFMERYGTPVKTERGNRVFPVSDHASDVTKAIHKCLEERNVKIFLNTEVKRLLVQDSEVAGVSVNTSHGSEDIKAKNVIVATGGLSYSTTGSTGDGYRFAADLGHDVTELRPSLVPLTVKEDYIKKLQGLSLKNVTLSFYKEDKKVYSGFGEMLFTHFGISGPLVLSASAVLTKKYGELNGLKGEIDLKSALSYEELDNRLLRDFKGNENKDFFNVAGGLLPGKLRPVMEELFPEGKGKKVNEITREDRRRFIELLKHFPLTVTGNTGFKEAVITQGGVNVKEIDPSTMRSKKIKGLYFAGEVLDVDALTGGFNLQIAFSTGVLSGISAGESLR